jgi:hypothetical protein
MRMKLKPNAPRDGSKESDFAGIANSHDHPSASIEDLLSKIAS